MLQPRGNFTIGNQRRALYRLDPIDVTKRAAFILVPLAFLPLPLFPEISYIASSRWAVVAGDSKLLVRRVVQLGASMRILTAT